MRGGESWGESTPPSNWGIEEGEGGRWRVKGTCLLQGEVATSGEREMVSEVLETGEHDLGGPGAGADSPRGPGV